MIMLLRMATLRKRGSSGTGEQCQTRHALTAIRSRRAVEVWKMLGDVDSGRLGRRLFNTLAEGDPTPDERREIGNTHIKGKGEVQSCGNYRRIKLMTHTMKMGERVVGRQIRAVINIGK